MIDELLAGHAPTDTTAGFWEAAARGELAIQRCGTCGHLQHPPRPCCAVCAATDLAFTPVAGAGSVHSYTVVERAFVEELRPHVPYVLGLVDLTQGPRLLTLLRVPAEQVQIDLPVRVAFEQIAGVALPVFVACD
jgi:uncharacterized OB-fold protein